MFNGSFLSSSFRVFFPLLSRRKALLVATTLTRDGGGCSGGHVIYLSPYYPPPSRARVSAFSTSLHLLPPAAASPRGAILGTPTISSSSSLFPSFPLGLRRRLDRERKPGLALPLSSAAVSLVSPIFRLLLQRLHSALPLYPPTSLFLPLSLCHLPSSFVLHRLNHMSGIFRQLFR